jgi:hypothetical protein
MTGCSGLGTKPTGTVDKPEQVRPDEAWLVKCAKTLPKLEGKTGADLVRNAADMSAQYMDCMERHNKLVEFEEKRLGN